MIYISRYEIIDKKTGDSLLSSVLSFLLDSNFTLLL